MDEEIWKAVVGFEGLYEVSNLGRVRSLDTLSFSGSGISQVKGRLIRGRVMALKTDKHGYIHLNLSTKHDSDGRRAKCRVAVHRLVAKAFHADSANVGNDVNHKDFNPSNNWESNLEWTTRKQNLQHSAKAGRMSGAKYRGRYTSALWASVIRALATGASVPDVSELTGVPTGMVYRARWMFKDLMGCVTAGS
jgi:hypothetical protein